LVTTFNYHIMTLSLLNELQVIRPEISDLKLNSSLEVIYWLIMQVQKGREMHKVRRS